MNTEENKKKLSGKDLISPDKINADKPKKGKKISVDKKDIVEREGDIDTEDGRKLLK